jgi:hypothetical protein
VASGRIQVTFDCSAPARLATFWAEALGYPPPDIEDIRARLRAIGMSEQDLDKWCRIEDPTGARPSLLFQQVPESKAVKNRIHLDVAVSSGKTVDGRQQIDAEVERLLRIGARKLHSVTDEAGYFVVMQDPEGNEFCVDL